MKPAILVAMLWVGGAMASMAQSPVYQLRIYKLHPGNEAHFHDRFRDQCIPMMKRYGFDIVFASQSGASGHAEFVYLLCWKDRATQVQAWKQFLADEEWGGSIPAVRLPSVCWQPGAHPSLRSRGGALHATGICLDPTGSGKTSIRGGIGLFYENVLMPMIASNSPTAPRQVPSAKF